jgi:hypothetical protein
MKRSLKDSNSNGKSSSVSCHLKICLTKSFKILDNEPIDSSVEEWEVTWNSENETIKVDGTTQMVEDKIGGIFDNDKGTVDQMGHINYSVGSKGPAKIGDLVKLIMQSNIEQVGTAKKTQYLSYQTPKIEDTMSVSPDDEVPALTIGVVNEGPAVVIEEEKAKQPPVNPIVKKPRKGSVQNSTNG